MKKFVPFLAVLFLAAFGAQAANVSEDRLVPNYVRGYGNSFIFVEDGITFSVYPDGEFDFYIDNRVNVGVGARIGNVGITFNSGYNYNPFVQYDDYGAVIQVENVPIFYDAFGRVSQIGNVDIWYRNGRVRRLGGLHVYWNGGVISHYTGFINIYNRRYVYRPFHRWFARPAVGFCTVWNTPYRRYYRPIRYTYHRPYRHNYRRAYAKIGREYRYERAPRRAKIYRNDRRVAVREVRGRRADYGRSNRNVSERRAVSRSNRSVGERRTVSRSDRGYRSNTDRVAVDRGRSAKRSDARRDDKAGKRSNRSATVSKRTVTKRPNSRTVTKREVTSTPRTKTVKRTTKTYKRPKAQSSKRSVARNDRSQNVRRSSTTQKRTVNRSSSSRNVQRKTAPQRKTVQRSASSSRKSSAKRSAPTSRRSSASSRTRSARNHK